MLQFLAKYLGIWNPYLQYFHACDLEFKLVLVHDCTDNVCLDHVGELYLSHIYGQRIDSVSVSWDGVVSLATVLLSTVVGLGQFAYKRFGLSVESRKWLI